MRRVYAADMKTLEKAAATITVEEFLREWPEELLARERELHITRDGTAIARLVAVDNSGDEKKEGPPFNFEEHRNWLKQNFPEGLDFNFQQSLQEDRDDRH